jgi:hypothetical protein
MYTRFPDGSTTRKPALVSIGIGVPVSALLVVSIACS